MIDITAAELAAATGGHLYAAAPDLVVSGAVVVDSRLAEPGSLFVAISGNNVDGADFAPTALDAGAVLVLADRPLVAPGADSAGVGTPVPTIVVPDVERALGQVAARILAKVREANPGLEVIAITGSYGKTTTKDTLAQLLMPGEDGYGGATIWPKGSFNNEIGLPLTVATIGADTRYAVLEMGADRPGNITDLTAIAPPNIGVVLAVGTAHLETFGTIEGIARGKSEMVTGTLPDGLVVLNADDPRVLAMVDKAKPEQRVVLFGTSELAEVRAENVRLDALDRASFDLVLSGAAGERNPVSLQLPGAHHVSNALAAASAALAVGIPVQIVASRLSAAQALSPHRMAVTERADGSIIIDDSYNANPDSMKAGLAALMRLASAGSAPRRRTVAILGEMRELGEESASEHDAVGREAVRLGVDRLVVVGEGAEPIYLGAQAEGAWGAAAQYVPGLNTARGAVSDLLEPNDVVLIKASNGSGLWQLADELVAAEVSAPTGAVVDEELAASARAARMALLDSEAEHPGGSAIDLEDPRSAAEGFPVGDSGGSTGTALGAGGSPGAGAAFGADTSIGNGATSGTSGSDSEGIN